MFVINIFQANTKSRYRSREVTSMVSSSGLMGGMMGESVAFPLLQVKYPFIVKLSKKISYKYHIYIVNL